MEKAVIIDGKSVRFRATALTPRLYRAQTQRDLFLDIAILEQAINDAAADKKPLSLSALTIFEDVAFTLAKQADSSVPDTADEWLDTFSVFDIYLILPQIIGLWHTNTTTTAKAKKKTRQTIRPNTGSMFMLRCAELGLSFTDLDTMTVGMVIDMLIERGNDHEKYPIKATQDDIDSFFGG